MNEWFYIDNGGAQQGPVDEPTLLNLNREGAVEARSLVWREGREEWVHFAEVAPELFGTTPDGLPVAVGVCAFSRRVYPLDEMLSYGDALVGAAHKEDFVQLLMETGRVGIADATVQRFEYVGFWWRVLSSFLDYLIKMVPSWIFMIPYYVVVFSSGINTVGEDPGSEPFVAMGVTYGIGMLGMLAFSIFYETWMVGRFQATAGKMIIGAKVVKPDGSRLTYKQAFLRWLVKKPLNYTLISVPPMLVFALIFGGLLAAAQAGGDDSAFFLLAIFTAIFAYVALTAICCGVYWMAAFDPEKRTLHDRIAATRVVKK